MMTIPISQADFSRCTVTRQRRGAVIFAKGHFSQGWRWPRPTPCHGFGFIQASLSLHYTVLLL